MDFKQQVYDIISQFSGQNNVIIVNIAFVDFTGDIETALLLSQIIYWTDRATRKDGFFYKTDEEWQNELRLSKYAIRKARKKLEEMGILETKVKKANGNPTVHYRLDKQRFVESFISFLRNRKNEIANSKEPNDEKEISLTETTTEITTESLLYDEEYEKLAFEYQKKIGQISGDAALQLLKWKNELGQELVLEAINIAYEQGKRRWSYINGILKNWKEDGITSLNDLEKQREKKPAPRRSGKADVWQAFSDYINSLGDEEDD